MTLISTCLGWNINVGFNPIYIYHIDTGGHHGVLNWILNKWELYYMHTFIIFPQFRAVMGKSISMYQVVKLSDPKLQNKQSIERCVQILAFLRLVTQVVLPKESLCWLVYNGVCVCLRCDIEVMPSYECQIKVSCQHLNRNYNT